VPTFRGNVGNLLQHWVLCEVLAACQSQYERLGFIDAYSMAPFAAERPKMEATSWLFDVVSSRLPGRQSLYERAWLKLVPSSHEYPNSASFVTTAWRGRYTLFLCESDDATIAQLNRWAGVAREFPGCEGVEVAPGDWRASLRTPVLPSSDLSYFSFDPYMFDRHGSGRNPGNMDPLDCDRLVEALDNVRGATIVQISTYSANNDNPQAKVREVISSRLQRSGLREAALVRADGNMMSLVFERGVAAAAGMTSLPSRFDEWLGAIKQ
jgi:hypothetical protein